MRRRETGPRTSARGLNPADAKQLAPVLATLHERLLRTGRSVEVRTFHAWFSQLLRAAPLELLAELGLQPDMDLLEDVQDHRADVYRRFYAAVIADEGLREDYRALVRDRGRSQLRKWLDAAWNKRIEIELADRAGTLEDSVPSAADHWVHLADLDHPFASPEDALGEVVVERSCGGARREQRGGRPQARRLLLEALALTDPMPRLAAARAALFTQKGELRKALADARGVNAAAAVLDEIERACQQQTAHDEHLRMVRLSRALSPNMQPTSVRVDSRT